MTQSQVEILLVDDNDDDVLLTEEAFNDCIHMHIGHVARDGVEALEFLRERIDSDSFAGIVLLDINMPRMNGFEVLAEMRDDDGLRHIPTVVLSASDREQDILQSYASGARTFLKKPPRFTEMRELVSSFCKYWATSAELPTFIA